MGGTQRNMSDLIVLQRTESPEALALLCLGHGSGAVYRKALRCTELLSSVAASMNCRTPLLISKQAQFSDSRAIIEEISKADNILMSSDTTTRWIDVCIAAKFDLGSDHDSIKQLNDELLQRTFVGHQSHVTASDFIVFGSIYHWMSQTQPAQLQTLVPLIRWYEFMQQLPGVCDIVKPVDLITRYEEGKKPAAANKKDSSPKAKEAAPKKEAKKEGPSKKAEEPSRPLEDPTRLEMKVGIITKVWEHPDADSLYCEEIDVGEGEVRKIASGLRKFVSMDKMTNAKVIILANMKVKNLRGYPSHGMVLCASNADHTQVELMHPPEGSKPGDLIKFAGLEGTHDEVLSTKKNQEPLPVILPHLRVDDKGVGYWKEHKMVHPAIEGDCACDSIRNGTIS
eukprot:Gregarina_sp_Pseudo_9__5055@NODE_530_length_2632_cov_272_690706_g500_i0_p1_GENE_NODE_530_length_2632_cov_272_690706_g500_i0NODE_530_length_2632_cov_272_690706_g500_i0_p1_ORF_typecomplete_len397_score118_35tRNA_bind/PF01588_20/8_9e03tRNA_bind/PF01588_20/4_6e25GST_C/PF00043_25/0_41_NODE_530_length_2632_cov_272_690706_g500_i06691859